MPEQDGAVSTKTWYTFLEDPVAPACFGFDFNKKPKPKSRY